MRKNSVSIPGVFRERTRGRHSPNHVEYAILHLIIQ